MASCASRATAYYHRPIRNNRLPLDDTLHYHLMIQNRHLMKRLLPLDDTESTNRRYADCHLTIRKLPSDDTDRGGFVLKTDLSTHYALLPTLYMRRG